MVECMPIPNAARAYLAACLCTLPASRAEKRPSIGRWKQYQNRWATSKTCRSTSKRAKPT
jgi:hypothetical protein